MKNESIIIYPGSFDPFTKGHCDLVLRALKIFDKVIISVLKNPKKKTLFSVDERADIIKSYFPNEGKVEVDIFSGLLVDYLKSRSINLIMRGLRMLSDFEYEFQMSLTNRKLHKEFEAIYLVPSAEYSFVSSSMVKEVAEFNGDLKLFINDYTRRKLNEKL